MRRTLLIAVLTGALLVLIAVPALGLASSADGTPQADSSEGNETAPGEQFSGVVGVQQAELEGDLDQRTFGIQIAQAATESAQADIVGDRLSNVSERLTELEERQNELEEKRDSGEITEGKYRAEMAKTVTEIEAVKQQTNQTERAAGNVSAAVLEERGVDTEALQTLKDRANELSGPEVAEIARSIAGPAIGETPASDRAGGPDDTPGGPEDTPANNSDDSSDPPDDNPGEGPPDDDDRGGQGDEGPPDDDDDDRGGQGDDRSDEGPPDDDDDRGGQGDDRGGEGPPDDDDR